MIPKLMTKENPRMSKGHFLYTPRIRGKIHIQASAIAKRFTPGVRRIEVVNKIHRRSSSSPVQKRYLTLYGLMYTSRIGLSFSTHENIFKFEHFFKIEINRSVRTYGKETIPNNKVTINSGMCFPWRYVKSEKWLLMLTTRCRLNMQTAAKSLHRHACHFRGRSECQDQDWARLWTLQESHSNIFVWEYGTVYLHKVGIKVETTDCSFSECAWGCRSWVETPELHQQPQKQLVAGASSLCRWYTLRYQVHD